jgi:hypothetical protein
LFIAINFGRTAFNLLVQIFKKSIKSLKRYIRKGKDELFSI